MTCQCEAVSELNGDSARRYAAEHLERIEVRADGWETLYLCPVTGRVWLKDYPRSAEQGGGPARLRQVIEE